MTSFDKALVERIAAHNTAFDPKSIPWIAEAAKSGRPIFPLTFVQGKDGEWKKERFFNKWPDVTVEAGLAMFRAHHNGLGLLTGGGLYAIDYDAYKDKDGAGRAALEDLALPATRTHQTLNGGMHFFFRVRASDMDAELRNTQSLLPCVDTRGIRGCVTFSGMHRVTRAISWAAIPWMPNNLLRLVRERMGGTTPNLKGGAGRRLETIDLVPVNERLVLGKLSRRLSADKGLLRHRWNGGADRLRDRSRSGFDASMAKLLLLHRFTPEEAMWLLAFHFKYGLGEGEPDHRNTVRQLSRAVGFAKASIEGEQQQMKEKLEAVPAQPTLAEVQEIMKRRKGWV